MLLAKRERHTTQAVRLFTTVGDDLVHTLPELLPLRGRRVEVLVLEEPDLAPMAGTAPWGFLEGKIRLKENFDDPLPAEVQRAFEGEST